MAGREFTPTLRESKEDTPEAKVDGECAVAVDGLPGIAANVTWRLQGESTRRSGSVVTVE